uniref:cyclic pyranopterin monophosphate synthase n=1 Tax=Arion vulgaris TaxID=1028688 RepID=A0A0B7A4M5_9EUPU
MKHLNGFVPWALNSCYHIVSKENNRHLMKMPSANSHLGAVLSSFSLFNHLWTRSSTYFYSNVRKKAEENSAAKYKVCHVKNDVDLSDTVEHSIPERQLMEMIGAEVKWKNTQSADNSLSRFKVRTEQMQLSEDGVSSCQVASNTAAYNISVLPNGFRLASVNVKHPPNNLLINVKVTSTLTRHHCLLNTVSKFSLLFMLNKSLFTCIPRTFSSSASSPFTLPSVVDENDILLNELSDNCDNNIGLKMSDGQLELIDELKAKTNHSESEKTIPLKSAYTKKDGTFESHAENTLSDLKHRENQNCSHNIYAKLYYKLWNGEKKLQNNTSDLPLEETTSRFDSYSEFYRTLMKTDVRDERGEAPTDYKLTHTDKDGKAVMVDVGDKMTTLREARAEARIYLGPEAGRLVKENKIKKGDVLTVAQIAGIMAAKQTPKLIPLCHNINLTKVDVICVLSETTDSVDITSLVRTIGVTGVEMEALTAVSIAALTIYDMCKAVTHDMVISDVRLVNKSGGKRNFQR